MTPMTSPETPTDAETQGRTFVPERTHLVAVFLFTGMALIGISWAPLQLGWLLIFPVLFVAWVLKAKTRVDDSGVSITYLLRKNVHIDWAEFKGVSFDGWLPKATTASGADYPMPGVNFNSLPALAEASNGRITDVITGAAEAADGMIEVIDHDGNGILLTKEEYEQRLAKAEETEVKETNDTKE